MSAPLQLPQQHTQIAHSQLAHSAPTTRVVAIPVRDLLRYEATYTSTSTVLYDIGVAQSTQLVHFLFYKVVKPIYARF